MNQLLMQDDGIRRLEELRYQNKYASLNHFRPSTLKIPEPRYRPNILGNMNTFGYAASAAAVGYWKELARSELGSAGNVITVSGLTTHRYYQCLSYVIPTGGNMASVLTMNNLTTNIYADRKSIDGAADATIVSAPNIDLDDGGSVPRTNQFYVSNVNGEEKLFINHDVFQSTAGAGNAPSRYESVHKAVPSPLTTDITRFDLTRSGPGQFNTGSQLIVLGWVDTLTHGITDNFYKFLGTDSGATLDITASAVKEWYKFAFLVRAGGAGTTLALRVGNASLDSGSNYSDRQSDDGSAEVTGINQTSIQLNQTTLTTNELLYVFGIMRNQSDKEKLIIMHTVDINPGTGAGNAPSRDEIVAKHVNTSNQDDHIGIIATAGSISATNSFGNLWGED